jgi:hypothetical protein
LDAAERLDADFGDDFLVGDDRHVGVFAFDEFAHKAAL